MSDHSRSPSFSSFFRSATGFSPFRFQEQFAHDLPELVHVPTGLGKTAMAVVGWLWRRFGADEHLRADTPRRLVYCLPMRVLVEQTRDNAVLWLHDLGLLAGAAEIDDQDGRRRLRSYTLDGDDSQNVAVHVLMGGEHENDWDICPERDAIIIGTQDMLLSRALNRGYAASRPRWPMQFGLLNTDSLWVFDEIQLMGTGLATTAQLAGFRRLLPGEAAATARNGHGCRSVWMSATMRRDWLRTVDFAKRVDGLSPLELTEEDHHIEAVEQRWSARKPLSRAKATGDDTANLAREVLAAHKATTRTIVVMNTVQRARDLHSKIAKEWGSASDQELVLLHSRFRPRDRATAVETALAEPPRGGTVVVSTQVIEAGVDVSATTLFTELAPWASLVQRFGRCNRKGEREDARVFWIDLPSDSKAREDTGVLWTDPPSDSKEQKKQALPYELADVLAAREEIEKRHDVGLRSLPDIELPFEHTHVIRRRDLIDLFDTTPDLAGNDIDIDRFVRDVEDSDVRVFWRAWDQASGNGPRPNAEQPAPRTEEICSAPFGEFKEFVKRSGTGKIWRWDFLGRTWERADVAAMAPGQVFLVHAEAGGYSSLSGWTGDPKDRPILDSEFVSENGHLPDSSEGDAPSRIGLWQTIAQHTDEVCRELDRILAPLSLTPTENEALRTAARWHDWGKAHDVFQDAVADDPSEQDDQIDRRERPTEWQGCRSVAKAPGSRRDSAGVVIGPGYWQRYRRRHFRHELASALAALDPRNTDIPDDTRDLVAYLVAAHHGKVRVSIRSLPNETRPAGGGRFARGVWDGDVLPATDLGGGVIAPEATLSLEPMEMGLCGEAPFKDQPAWVDRMIQLREELGPFRLAFLEAILRAADMRASRSAEGRAETKGSTDG